MPRYQLNKSNSAPNTHRSSHSVPAVHALSTALAPGNHIVIANICLHCICPAHIYTDIQLYRHPAHTRFISMYNFPSSSSVLCYGSKMLLVVFVCVFGCHDLPHVVCRGNTALWMWANTAFRQGTLYTPAQTDAWIDAFGRRCQRLRWCPPIYMNDDKIGEN